MRIDESPRTQRATLENGSEQHKVTGGDRYGREAQRPLFVSDRRRRRVYLLSYKQSSCQRTVWAGNAVPRSHVRCRSTTKGACYQREGHRHVLNGVSRKSISSCRRFQGLTNGVLCASAQMATLSLKPITGAYTAKCHRALSSLPGRLRATRLPNARSNDVSPSAVSPCPVALPKASFSVQSSRNRVFLRRGSQRLRCITSDLVK